MIRKPCIAILIATYNAKKYIKEQFVSLLSQSYKNINVYVRDDRSIDNTLGMLSSYQNIKFIPSIENIGAKNSFAALLNYAINSNESEYFMFCDQDDVWNDDKVEKTFAKMRDMEKEFPDTPLLVHTDLTVVDEQLNVINDSFMQFQKIDARKNKLNNFLMQNTVTGCTMMINKKLALMCADIPKEAIMHDWWIALVASKFGSIGFIDEPTIKYRQHGNNTVGAKGFNINFIINNIFKKIYIQKNTVQAKAFLKQFETELDTDTKKILEDFSSLHEKLFLQRRVILYKNKLFKQGLIRNIGLFLKV